MAQEAMRTINEGISSIPNERGIIRMPLIKTGHKDNEGITSLTGRSLTENKRTENELGSSEYH